MSLAEKTEQFLEKEYSGSTTAVYRDLSLNFKKILHDSSLEPREVFLNLLSLSMALENFSLADFARSQLIELGTTAAQIQEAAEVAGIMGMNNIYYKFKSFLPEEVAPEYQRSGLRMASLVTTLHAKKEMEMMALSISIVNGCAVCVESHEKTAREHGVSVEKIHDLARLAAIAKGLSSLKKAMTFSERFQDKI